MKKFMLVFMVSVTAFFVSCDTIKQVIQPKSNPKYKFNDNPYDEIDLVEQDLYNYVFALTKNRLKYYVENTFDSYPDLIGLVLDLKMRGHQTIFRNIVESPVQFGWSIYDEDIVPLSAKEISQLNAGSSPRCEVCKYPKVRYLVKVKDKNAVVYVSYWIKQYKIYNFIYTIQKQARGWTILDSVER